MAPNINSVYNFLLTNLKLDSKHAANLSSRGLSQEQIDALGYKTKPPRCTPIVDKAAGEFDLEGVPGFYKRDKKWMLGGALGMLIPVRDIHGSIISMKIRSDDTDGKAKYLQLSSNPKSESKEGVKKYPGGTAAKIAVHFPCVGKMDKVLRVTEGELKADIATIISGVYTISIPGIAMWQWAIEAIEELKPEKVLLAFDSDKNKEFSTSTGKSEKDTDPYQVAKALSHLYLALIDKGIPVAIEDWKEEYGKGIDDVLAQGHSDKVEELSNEDAEAFVKKSLAKDMPLGWIYIIGTKRFINVENNQELDKEQFTDKHAEKVKSAADKVMSLPGFPKADLPIYEPGKDIIIQKDGMRLFNTWKKGTLVAEEGDIQMFLEHAEYILPDERERDILFNVMAHIIQKPGKKIHWAILLQSVAGAGKSYFGDVMRLCLGKSNVSTPSNEAIHESYTGWQKSCQLVIIEELMARGRMELMNKLKPMITQPIANIREMYKPAYEQPNRFNMMMFTNYEDAIVIDENDRRYCVLFSIAIPKLPEYYKELFKWTEANAGKILNWLAKRDISQFEAMGHAPMTSSKEQLITESMPPLHKWLKDSIENEVWPLACDLATTVHLAEHTPKHLRGVTPTQIGKVLRKLGVRELKQVKLTVGGHVRLLSLRRHEMYKSASDEKLVRCYEDDGLNGQPGGDPLHDKSMFN